MAQHSIPFSVTFGDWSDDGHGKTDVHQIEVYSTDGSRLTEELLKANYEANVAKLGFGLPALWSDYAQFSPSEKQIIAIQQELGAVYYGDSELAEARSDINILSADDLEVYGDGELPANAFYIITGYRSNELALENDGVEDNLRLAMLLVLTGLPAVSWKLVKPARSLFGDAGSVLTGNSHVGYGLFF